MLISRDLITKELVDEVMYVGQHSFTPESLQSDHGVHKVRNLYVMEMIDFPTLHCPDPAYRFGQVP